MQNQQEVPPLGLEERDYSCQHSLAETAWTRAAQFLLPRFIYGCEICSLQYKKQLKGENLAKWRSVEVLYEQIRDSSRETLVNMSAGSYEDHLDDMFGSSRVSFDHHFINSKTIAPTS